jgi:hypothetical protein
MKHFHSITASNLDNNLDPTLSLSLNFSGLSATESQPETLDQWTDYNTGFGGNHVTEGQEPDDEAENILVDTTIHPIGETLSSTNPYQPAGASPSTSDTSSPTHNGEPSSTRIDASSYATAPSICCNVTTFNVSFICRNATTTSSIHHQCAATSHSSSRNIGAGALIDNANTHHCHTSKLFSQY